MAIPRRQKAACIRALSAVLAICLLPMGAAHAELFGPHYRSWGWDDYRPHYRSWRHVSSGLRALASSPHQLALLAFVKR